MKVQVPHCIRLLMGKLLWRMDTSSKIIYLTFDDGPEPEVTPQVLDILETMDVRATFFCLGKNVQLYPELYAEILARGHRVGNHTFNHLKGFHSATDEYVRDVKKAALCIDSKLFRPPHGQLRYTQIKALKKDYSIVMWDVLTRDYNKKISPERIMQSIQRYSRNGSIVVFHDSIKAKSNLLTVLPLAIDYWKMKGYEFDVL